MELNRAIIEAAIVGFEKQKQQIDETIAELRTQLNGASPKAGRETKAAATTTKRVLSPEARKRIAAAQKARWAAFHANQKTAAAPAKKPASPKKRTLSPEAKAKLAANLAKARAAKAKKAAA